ncbi:AAA family ATPase [Geodermatophilus sp. SYSU D00758]
MLDVLRDRDCRPRQGAGGQWSARCPAHEDRSPSLSLRQIEGQALVYCHAGCATLDVLTALGLTLADLYDEPKGAAYRYDDGRVVHRSPDKRFRQSGRTQGTASLYRLGKVTNAVAAGRTVYLVEGEKDVHALESVGLVATTSPMGSANWGKVDPSPLAGARVVLVADNDEPGRRYAGEATASLGAIGATVTVVTAKIGKDAADHIAAGHGPDEFVPMPTGKAEPAPGDTWRPVDLADIVAGVLSGQITRHEPTIGARDDGAGLFYAGKVNGIAGPSGSGKSWTALLVTTQQLTAGHPVVYVDLEDDAAGVVGRLLDLGAAPEAITGRFIYVHPDESYGSAAAYRLVAIVNERQPALVVIDSTGESMALDGAKPNDDDDTARWFRRLPTAIANLGPAVVVLDHVVKADDGGLWPIGSQRKRAAISGAQYMQTTVRPFAKDTAGAARLVCAKDRHGNYRPGQKVAELTVAPTEDGVHLTLRAPTEATQQPQDVFRPTGLMEKVSRALEGVDEPLSFRGIDDRVQGKQQHIAQALDVLVAEGHVQRTAGPRNAKLHTLVRPYRQATDPASDAYEPGRQSTVSDDCVSVSPYRGETGDRHSLSPGRRSGDGGRQSDADRFLTRADYENNGRALRERVVGVVAS